MVLSVVKERGACEPRSFYIRPATASDQGNSDMVDQDVQATLPSESVPAGESDFRAGTRPAFTSRVCQALLRRVHSLRWRSKMAHFGKGASIAAPSWIVNPGAIEVGNHVNIWHHSRMEAICSPKNAGTIRLSIGEGTAIQPYVHIGAAQRVTLGKHVMIASNVYITDHDHDLSDPMDPASVNSRLQTAPVHIGDYTWLGEKVMVLKGVSIGDRSVIGAGAVVTRDIPPMSIAVGSPARVIRRYDEQAGRWVSVSDKTQG